MNRWPATPPPTSSPANATRSWSAAAARRCAACSVAGPGLRRQAGPPEHLRPARHPPRRRPGARLDRPEQHDLGQQWRRQEPRRHRRRRLPGPVRAPGPGAEDARALGTQPRKTPTPHGRGLYRRIHPRPARPCQTSSQPGPRMRRRPVLSSTGAIDEQIQSLAGRPRVRGPVPGHGRAGRRPARTADRRGQLGHGRRLGHRHRRGGRHQPDGGTHGRRRQPAVPRQLHQVRRRFRPGARRQRDAQADPGRSRPPGHLLHHHAGLAGGEQGDRGRARAQPVTGRGGLGHRAGRRPPVHFQDAADRPPDDRPHRRLHGQAGLEAGGLHGPGGLLRRGRLGRVQADRHAQGPGDRRRRALLARRHQLHAAGAARVAEETRRGLFPRHPALVRAGHRDAAPRRLQGSGAAWRRLGHAGLHGGRQEGGRRRAGRHLGPARVSPAARRPSAQVRHRRVRAGL